MFKTYCKALYRSFYDVALYRDVLFQWKGFGLLYMTLLAAIVSLVMTVTLGLLINAFKATELPHIVSQMPEIVMSDGEITVHGPQRVLIEGRSRPYSILIDTKASKEELQKDGPIIAMNSDTLLMKGRHRYEDVDISKVKKFVLNGKTLQSIFESLPNWVPVFWPFLLVGQLIALLLQVAVLTLLSYVVTAFLKEEYDVETRLRFSAVAQTPGLLVSTFLMFGLGHKTGYWFVILVALLYMYVMIMMMRRLPAAKAG